MSWPMPTATPWNPGIAPIAPDMNMAAATYTPEQWTAMQQQNWQQWAQWHQQYAQWQSQYGDKYAEQMQSMQHAMAGMPPLPPTNVAVPLPAPPPPDHPPPPPPPHENNQPLYSQPQSLPTPVPAPVSKQSQNVNPAMFTHDNNKAGNNQNSSYAVDTRSEPSPPVVNTEALKKLAEEERLFDIQFQKWEQEIEKWRRENVNHPDKKAYKEYEQKFEACRAQLLERRQQMNQKRARLLNNVPQALNNTATHSATAIQKSSATPQQPSTVLQQSTPQQNTSNIYNQNIQSKNYNITQPAQSYMNQKNTTPYQHYENTSQYNRNSNNKNIDPQDRYESYEDTYSYDHSEDSKFLPGSDSAKGIPGLDLVPLEDSTKNTQIKEVIDITEEYVENQQESLPSAPDYSTISKGINSILGDEKIMNILSMVRDQSAPSGTINNQSINVSSGPYKSNVNNFTIPSNNQWGRNQNNINSQQYEERQQSVPYNRQVPNSSYLMQQGQDEKSRYMPIQKRMYDKQQADISQEPYYERNNEYGDQSIPPRAGPLSNTRPNVPPPRPLLQDVPMEHMNQNRNDYRGPLDDRNIHSNDTNPPTNQPVRPKWMEEPMFTPSIIVEYEHKPLRLKARDFIEPVHMFDYNHTSKEEDKTKDFEKEVDELFLRKPRRLDIDDNGVGFDRFEREYHFRDYERKQGPREDREDYRTRGLLRDEYDDRRRSDTRYDDRRRDDRDRFSRRDDLYNRDRERDRDKDLHRYRDHRRDDNRNRSRSRDRDLRKRGHSKDSEISDSSLSKKTKEMNPTSVPKHVVMIDDLLEPPGRDMRPHKIVVILRGPPGSGKSYLAKLIRDREAELGGTVRIMSIDDYYMQEGEIEEKDPTSGKIIKRPSLKYEYEGKSEETYISCLKRAFRRTITDGYFTFLIYDAVNDQLKCYADIWNFARQNGFQVYVCTMELDSQICFKRNIHNRALEDIEIICSRFFPTPSHHIQLDATTLLQSAAIPEVQMEDVSDEVTAEDAQETDEVENLFTSKWERMDDAAQLARLDGTSKPLRPSQLSMEDYLQLDDWKPTSAKPGKKTVLRRVCFIQSLQRQDKYITAMA